MRHARPDDLLPIAPLLAELRRIPGLVERTPGSFYRKGAGMLHFHRGRVGGGAGGDGALGRSLDGP